MLHIVYRVGDLDKTIKFYTECLGRYTNAFLGYGPEDSHYVVELTYNYGVDKYDIGNGFDHFGIAVEDFALTKEALSYTEVMRQVGLVKGGSTVIAFIADPDGYKFEL
ncbi:hypothetical protein C5167_045327 [Papaver somniferum]|uniref:VOC domain-containing protein n=1 Tax=Papaver somniferum TaxID=3469 RepID=A0A4Y7LD24_PAPSO|nr:hypothetical protein C5167_045327 [Papaver somniferum]